MKKIAISKFKAKCLAVLETIAKSASPLSTLDRKSWFGCMEGTAIMMDDLIEPTGAQWDVLK